MCQQCSEGSIQTNGYCDMCGFNELRYIEEYELWLTSLQEPAFIAEWEAYIASLEVKELPWAA